MAKEIEFDPFSFDEGVLSKISPVAAYKKRPATEADISSILDDESLTFEQRSREIIELSQSKVLKMLPMIVDFCEDVLEDENVSAKNKISIATKLLDKIMPNFKHEETDVTTPINLIIGGKQINNLNQPDVLDGNE